MYETELAILLGISIVCRSFVNIYSNYIVPLVWLLNANSLEKIYAINYDQQCAFRKSINEVAIPRILESPNPRFPYGVDTDAPTY